MALGEPIYSPALTVRIAMAIAEAADSLDGCSDATEDASDRFIPIFARRERESFSRFPIERGEVVLRGVVDSQVIKDRLAHGLQERPRCRDGPHRDRRRDVRGPCSTVH